MIRGFGVLGENSEQDAIVAAICFGACAGGRRSERELHATFAERGDDSVKRECYVPVAVIQTHVFARHGVKPHVANHKLCLRQ